MTTYTLKRASIFVDRLEHLSPTAIRSYVPLPVENTYSPQRSRLIPHKTPPVAQIARPFLRLMLNDHPLSAMNLFVVFYQRIASASGKVNPVKGHYLLRGSRYTTCSTRRQDYPELSAGSRLQDLRAFLRGISTYHDNNMLEKARARQKPVATSVSIEMIPGCVVDGCWPSRLRPCFRPRFLPYRGA